MKYLQLLFLTAMLFTTTVSAQINIDTSTNVKNNKQLYAIVISQNDDITFQRYYNGKAEKDLFNNQSLTKSIVSLLIGIAIDKGYINSVDDKLVKYIPQIASDFDKRKQEITIRQVMNQASGLWHENPENLQQYFALDNPSDYVLKASLISQPGAVFHYNNAASHLLSVVLTKATHMETLAFAKKYLFGPLNIKNIKWDKMNDGYYDGCGLLSVQMLATDMNKIGRLVLQKGLYDHKNIISEKWINEIMKPLKLYNTLWGFDGSMYGLCWYHYNYKGTLITYCLGWGGQFVFVIPDKNAVVNVNESIGDATAVMASNLFLYKIFPLIYSQLK